LQDIDRASEYAQRVNDKEVWTLLGKAQLDANMIKDAIDSYIKANDATNNEVSIICLNLVI
jgi:clathrin heavy chain